MFGLGCPHGVGVELSAWNGTSEKSGLMSDALSSLAWISDAVGVEEVDDEDDEDLLDDEDDELLEELLDELDELDELDDEDDDGLPLDAATLSLSSLRVSKNAAIAMISTATTPTMIHLALLDPAPGGGPPGVGPPGGGPPGGTGPGGSPGPPGGTTGIAAVGGAVGGSAAEMGWVSGAW